MCLLLVRKQTLGAGVQLNGSRTRKSANMLQHKGFVTRAVLATGHLERGVVVRGYHGRDWTEKGQRCVGVLVSGFHGTCRNIIFMW